MPDLEVTQVLPWEIAAVHNLRYRVMDQPLGIVDEKRLSEGDSDPESILMGGYIGSQLISTVRLDLVNEQEFRVRRMATEPEFQRRGYGAQTLLIAEQLAWQRGAEQITLYSRLGAVPFYESLKYGAASSVPEWYDGQLNLEMLKLRSRA